MQIVTLYGQDHLIINSFLGQAIRGCQYAVERLDSVPLGLCLDIKNVHIVSRAWPTNSSVHCELILDPMYSICQHGQLSVSVFYFSLSLPILLFELE